ncbi:MAG TPA: hypothetical protein PKM41_09695 [Deltaproteobacteria bacterium]|nr:hypothetical protein [Deltaproteobacteria bacterium]HOI07753.1 hypothetical protein [Deltaproteobacteria bacterium]
MRLSLLLFILSLKLKLAAKTNRAFMNYIGTIKLNILIKTADGKWGRLFVFKEGTVSSVSGDNHACDAALVWSDSGTGFRTMVKASDEASFRAAAAGKLKVEGMAYYIQWFNDAVKLTM